MNQILIVDDDKRIRMVVKKYFTSLGHIVDEAENGVIAVSMVKNAPQKYHVIIMDMLMPEMNGLEAFEELNSAKIEVPVIMATAFGNITLGIEFMKKGGSDFIEKPLSLEILAIKVNQVLENKRLHESLLSEKVLKQAILEAGQLKRNFLNKITHEFRTPIHAILNFSKFGISSDSDEKKTTYFQNINQSGNKLLELIDGLMAYSKMETDIGNFDIKPDDLVSVFQQALSEYQSIRSDDTSDVTLLNLSESNYTHFDAKRLKQTFFRVLDNLYKFAPEIKNIFVVFKSSTIKIGVEGSVSTVLPAIRFYFAKFTDAIKEDKVESTIIDFVSQFKDKSEAMVDDFDLLLYENIIKAHRGEFRRVYIPDKGILFEISLPLTK